MTPCEALTLLRQLRDGADLETGIPETAGPEFSSNSAVVADAVYFDAAIKDVCQCIQIAAKKIVDQVQGDNRPISSKGLTQTQARAVKVGPGLTDTLCNLNTMRKSLILAVDNDGPIVQPAPATGDPTTGIQLFRSNMPLVVDETLWGAWTQLPWVVFNLAGVTVAILVLEEIYLNSQP